MWTQQTSVAKTEELTAPPAAMAGSGVAFRPFLQSELWEEQNGMPLSILSALARLDLDPWDEAAMLAMLPKETASPRFSALIQRLLDAPAGRNFRDPLWMRALVLLPGSSEAAPSAEITARSSWRRWISILELAYFGSMRAYYARSVSHLPAAHVDAAMPGPPAAVSPQPSPPSLR